MYTGSVGDTVEEDPRVNLRRLDNSVRGYRLVRGKATDLGEVFCGGEEPRFSLQTLRTSEIALR